MSLERLARLAWLTFSLLGAFLFGCTANLPAPVLEGSQGRLNAEGLPAIKASSSQSPVPLPAPSSPSPSPSKPSALSASPQSVPSASPSPLNPSPLPKPLGAVAPPPKNIAPSVNNDEPYTVKQGDTLFAIARANRLNFLDLAEWNGIEPDSIRAGQQIRLSPAPKNLSAPAATPATTPSPNLDSAAGAVKPETKKPLVFLPEKEVLSTTPATVSPGDKLSVKDKEKPIEKATDKATDTKVRASPMGEIVPYSKANYARMSKTITDGTAVKPQESATIVDAGQGLEAIDWAWPTNGSLSAGYNEESSKGVLIPGAMGQGVNASGAGKVIFSGTGIRGLGNLVVIRHNRSFLSVYGHNSKLLVKEGQTVSKGQKIAEMGDTDSDKVQLHFEIRRLGKPVDPIQYLPSR